MDDHGFCLLGAGSEIAPGFSEHTSGDDPSDRAPRAGEEEDVDANKSDQGLVSLGLARESGADTGDDQLADSHTDGTKHEQVATTPLLDHPQTGEGGCDVNDVGNNSDGETVRDTRVLEEGGAVVDYEEISKTIHAR